MDIDRLMIFVIVGRTDLHCLRREVGIGSRSHEVSGELDKSAETSAMVDLMNFFRKTILLI